MKIERGVKARPVKCLLAGVESVGKTSLAAKCPNPLFIDIEDGSANVDVARVRSQSWADTLGTVIELGRGSAEFGTVVVDSIDWAEKQLVDHVCRKAEKPSVEAFGFGKGYVMVAEEYARFLAALDQVVAAGISVVLIGHVGVKRVAPPDQPDGFDRFELRQSKHVSPLSKEWVDVMAFLQFDEKLVTGQDGRKRAAGGKKRVAHLERCAAWDAKNRYGWPGTVDFDELSKLLNAKIAAGAASLPPEVSEVPPVDERPTAGDILRHIKDAKDSKRLRNMSRRVQDLGADGDLTADEVAGLLNAIDERLQEAVAQ